MIFMTFFMLAFSETRLIDVVSCHQKSFYFMYFFCDLVGWFKLYCLLRFNKTVATAVENRPAMTFGNGTTLDVQNQLLKGALAHRFARDHFPNLLGRVVDLLSSSTMHIAYCAFKKD